MKQSNLVLTIIALSFAVTGAIENFLPNETQQTSAVIHGLFISILSFMWCKFHSKELQVKTPTGSGLMCGLLPIIGAPVYFYRAFGFKSGSFKSLKMVTYAISLILIYSAGQYVASVHGL
jgi:hypothetical protein